MNTFGYKSYCFFHKITKCNIKHVIKKEIASSSVWIWMYELASKKRLPHQFMYNSITAF